MELKINNRLAFIQNRCQICIYEKYKNLENMQDFLWNNVSKIVYFTNDPQICSICFDESILPRMDRCGHFFCLSCILNFLEITNKDRVLCPMCKDIEIHVNSFKRVNFCENDIPKVGESVTFRLMVKGNDNVCPRFADNLCDYSDHVIPRDGSSISKFLGVVVERDYNAYENIKHDIALLKQRRRKFSKRNFAQSMLHLRSEMEHFKNEIRIIDRENSVSVFSNAAQKFNLLEHGKMKDRFKLFYQCGRFNYVLLDEDIQEEVFTAAEEAGQVLPVSVTGEITAIRTEVVDDEFLLRSKLNHFFQGAKISYLSIDLNMSSRESIGNYPLKELRSHQEVLFKAEKEEEELRERVAKRAAERKNSRPPNRIFSGNTNHDPDNCMQNIADLKRKFENIVEGFNTCTLGIDCLVPDDDYPHAENCIHYCKDSSVSKEILPEDKYFGLLRFKLNVFRGNQDDAPRVVEDPPNKNEVKRSYNYPPEIIPLNEMFVPVRSNMMSAYMVPKKSNSQLQQKQMRKLKKSIPKIS